MDGVRVIVRDGEGRCASASADVHIKAAASSDLTVVHEGDVFMELLEDTTGTLPPLQIGGAGALNVSVEASCGGIFELEAGDNIRIWARGARWFQASHSKTAEAALARVAFAPRCTRRLGRRPSGAVRPSSGFCHPVCGRTRRPSL